MLCLSWELSYFCPNLKRVQKPFHILFSRKRCDFAHPRLLYNRQFLVQYRPLTGWSGFCCKLAGHCLLKGQCRRCCLGYGGNMLGKARLRCRNSLHLMLQGSHIVVLKNVVSSQVWIGIVLSNSRYGCRYPLAEIAERRTSVAGELCLVSDWWGPDSVELSYSTMPLVCTH